MPAPVRLALCCLSKKCTLWVGGQPQWRKMGYSFTKPGTTAIFTRQTPAGGGIQLGKRPSSG